MNQEQFNTAFAGRCAEWRSFHVNVADLKDKSDRTLLWGYDCDRNSFHVYLKEGRFCTYIYGYKGERLHYSNGTDIDLDDEYTVPNKRLYPEACDHEYCLLLQALGVRLPFTSFDDNRPPKQYYGKLYGEEGTETAAST